MKKTILLKSFFLILSVILIGCQPSQEAIDKAIAETQTIEREYQQQTEEVIQQLTQEAVDKKKTQEAITSATSTAQALSIAQTQEALPRNCTANGIYNDFSGDVDIDFIDILKVETTLEEGILSVTFHLAGLPNEITINDDSLENFKQEYFWGVQIDTDNESDTGRSTFGRPEGVEYSMSLFNFKQGQEKTGSFEDVFRNNAYIWIINEDGSSKTIKKAQFKVDYDLSTITLSGSVPDINESSLLYFGTSYRILESDLLCE